MYKLCITEKSALHQRQLETAFLSLALQQNYDDITISAICQKAGLSRKVFYRLFENKNDVLYALIDHTLSAFEAYHPGEDSLLRFFSFWKENQSLLDALDRSGCSALLLDRVARFALTSTPHILWDISPKLMCCQRNAMMFYISGIFGMMLDWHIRSFDTPITEMAATLQALLSNPLYPQN